MSQKSPLWFKVDNKPDYVGYRLIYIEDMIRTVQGVPNNPLNPGDIAYRMLSQTMRDWGYSIDIFAGGAVKVYLPMRDEWGKVCREIARTFWLASNSPNPRSPQ